MQNRMQNNGKGKVCQYMEVNIDEDITRMSNGV